MKKLIIIAIAFLYFFGYTQAQLHCYWVFLTDKQGTTFDPYTYFDQKAIERYRLNGADLYDSTNYPLNASYVGQVNALATEEVGQSRWLNAAAVTATPEQAANIERLPFVKNVVPIKNNWQPAFYKGPDYSESSYNSQSADLDSQLGKLHEQLQRMGGQYFRAKGINGKGVRIAILDGGFPQVNTHVAFKHVRDEHRIIKTYNFPNKKEDVYGWNSHGLMTFGCIAARQGDMDLGMATGAEFLLARTEIEAEPFKEEVWWQMGMEWADKNGAQIISSSLGYGKDRYFTKDMDGQSYVAKAGNLAARKGILVCNSAGNEGDDKTWRTIITPADADSVLCVGGLNNSLDTYQLTDFSSYGPSADGRQKPNVVAWAWAWSANTGKTDDKYTLVPGTSFSCPLVAGFAACALQAKPGMKAMELFHEIEKSADLYPYCDYSFGYGVPQADYFTGDRKAVKPTFRFEKNDTCLRVIPLTEHGKCRLFVKTSTGGQITQYEKLELPKFNPGMAIMIYDGDMVTVQFDGYVDSIKCGKGQNITVWVDGLNIGEWTITNKLHFSTQLNENQTKSEWYGMLGIALGTDDQELTTNIWSPAKRIGFRRVKHLTKAYGLGFAFEYGHSSYILGKEAGSLDSLMNMDDDVRWLDGGVRRHKVNVGEIGIELFQRVRLRPLGMFHRGWHWDLGVYGNWGFNVYKLKGVHNYDVMASTRKQVLRNISPLSDYRWNYGLTTRLTRDWIGLYARYRLNGIGQEPSDGKVLLPRLEVGIQLAF